MSTRSPRAGVRIASCLWLLSAALGGAGCKRYDVPHDTLTFAGCCGALGTCVPAALVSPPLAAYLAADSCGPALLCAPTVLVENPAASPARCHAAANLEGRCLPTCLPDVVARKGQLTRRDCAEGEACVPCFDPRTGEDSGACRLGGDPGPSEPARELPSCGGQQGRCLSLELLSQSVDAADLARLGRDTCAAADERCLPRKWLEASQPTAASCHAAGGLEGRCLPSYLPEVIAQADRLQQRSCEDGELCAPCFDPRTGEDSGACRLGHDAPREPALLYSPCCQALGRCVPRETLSQSIAPQDLRRLPDDTCEAENLCVPSAWLNAQTPAPNRCRAPGDLEGRCLPSCLPAVAERASQLRRSSCDTGEACVPCYDPQSGQDTQACRIGRDQPVEPARSFARCCGALGRCVPRELLHGAVQDRDLERLAADSCEQNAALCVPEAWLDAAPKPAACRAPGDLEGRCLPSCLPAVAARAENLRQSSCESGEACVPCYDPQSGADTGACNVGRDQPHEAAHGFEPCCEVRGQALGSCVPVGLLGASEQQSLPLGSCHTYDARCVPRQLTAAGSGNLTRCTSRGSNLASTKGVCLGECFINSPLATLLPRTGCGDAERCAPCSELPLSVAGCD